MLDRRLGLGGRAGGARAAGANAMTPGAGAAGGVGFALLAVQDRFRAFALRPGVDLVMDGDRLRRQARARRPGHHRRRPDRRPDRLRQDRARRRATGRGGGRAVHRGRWRGRGRGHRCARGGRRRRGPGRRSGRSRSRRRWRRGPRRSSAAASGWPDWCRPGDRHARPATAAARSRPARRSASSPNPGASYAKRLERYRPGLVPFVLDGLDVDLRAARSGSAASTRRAS